MIEEAASSHADLSGPGPGERVLPGEEGVWMFVLGDMMMFALFFGGYVFYRAQEIPLFDASQRALDTNLGAINTLLLLTSSWFVALGVDSVRKAQAGRALRLLLFAFACGAGFVVVKAFEYGAKISAGITPVTNDFFMFYFMLTGIHLVHLLGGLGVLAFLILRVRRPKPADAATFESGATFWHMVDLLWIVLFALLYLVK